MRTPLRLSSKMLTGAWKPRFRPGQGATWRRRRQKSSPLACPPRAVLPARATGGTMRAFIFPGQGSQAVGMGKALTEASSAARDVFGEVDEALAQKLSRLMAE